MLLDFFYHLQGRVRMARAVARAAQVVDHDFRPAPRQLDRIGPAEAAAGAGDNGDFVLERNGHGEILLLPDAGLRARKVCCGVGIIRSAMQQGARRDAMP